MTGTSYVRVSDMLARAATLRTTREVLIGTSTVADSTGFIFTRDGTYANPIDPGGRYRAVWNRVGPPAPGLGPAAIAHDGWLFAAGGIAT